MSLSLNKSKVQSGRTIEITGSKSESNRLLILQALYPAISIENLSNSDDTRLLKSALQNNEAIVDIHHAGTAMRFLTAYYAIKKDHAVVLTGSKRMKERPIKILVSALRDLGAEIEYLENEGCPPIKITGKTLSKNSVALDADVSSQYISALMLIAPNLKDGLEIYLKGKITSVPYINMTLNLLRSVGINGSFAENTIKIEPIKKLERPVKLTVESDWSSASYFYSIIALSEPGTSVSLTHYKIESLQGDSILPKIYDMMGVETSFSKNLIVLKKLLDKNIKSLIELDLSDSPDIAQTIVVSCLGLGIECRLSGLHTLKIKETDRLVALKNEIEKLGGNIEITSNSLRLTPSQSLNEQIEIETYHDHRMAMAFAPLALRVPITIKESDVVSKSYPTFWSDLSSIGFSF